MKFLALALDYYPRIATNRLHFYLGRLFRQPIPL